MHLNLNQLRAFYLSARKNSINKAAEALHVTQPAVTMQIKAFENQLNVKLFRKYGNELQLTDVGQVLYGYATRMFNIVDEIEYVLKSYGNLTQGSLTNEGPIWIQTDIVSARRNNLTPPAQAFLRIIRSGLKKSKESAYV